MRTNRFAPNLRAWSALLCALTVASIILLALCASSCSARRRVDTSQTSALSLDSTFFKVKRTERSVSLPSETVALRLPLTSLLDSLPAGATFYQRAGRSSLSVRPQKNADGSVDVLVTGVCDSLQQRVTELESELGKTQKRLNEQQTHVVRETSGIRLSHLIWSLIIGILLGGFVFHKLRLHQVLTSNN